MAAPLIKSDASLVSMLEDATFTQARLAASPLTSALAADFDAFLPQWKAVHEQEITLRIAIVKAGAVVSASDDALNSLVDEVAQAVLIEVKNNRKAPLYVLYFGEKSPAQLKKPVLAGQLETMRGWTPSLLGASNSALQAIGAKLQAAVAAADTSVASLAAAEQAMRDFRTIGERRSLVDGLNALRKSTYGKLSEMPHAQPALQLAATFAEDFFRHESRRAPTPPSSAKLAETIASLQAEIDERKADLVTTLAAEEAAAKALADAAAHDAAIAEAKKEAKDAAAKVAALEAQKK